MLQKISSKTNHTILAGDIGATKTLLAIFSVSEGQILKVREERFITRDCDSFEEVIREFLHNEVVGVIGVIGPTRMAYERVIPIVDVSAKILGAALARR